MPSHRLYFSWLLGLIAAELLSWLAFSSSTSPHTFASPMGIVFGLIVLAGISLAIWRPSWLAWVTVAEIVIGGKGYLFFLETNGQKLSIRLALFITLMIAALWQLVVNRRMSLPRQVAWPVGLLLGWVLVMSVIGILRGYGAGTVFTDMNGYLYMAIILPWWLWLRRQENWLEYLLGVLLAGATFVGLKSWLLQLIFAQDVAQLTTIYRWIRQTGIGEITLISKNVYRIFFQSQIYTLLIFLLVVVGHGRSQSKPWWSWAALGTSLGIYLSLSRSLWLGLGVALFSYVVVLLWQRQWLTLRRATIVIPLAAFVWLMTAWALNFPYIVPPPGHVSKANSVVARLKSAGSSQASTARANQLPPLLKAIGRNPVTGQGFGATLTYYSTDPRIKGQRTTSAFELGYFDMLFHIGLVGVGLLGWWLWFVVRRLWRRPDAWLWLFPTIGLATVHVTSPYLNHPLGLSWLILITLIAYDHD